MKVIIAGSRKGLDEQAAKDEIRIAATWLPPITEVVSGAARGVDKWGEQYAEQKGLPVKRFSADWKRLGVAAGPVRNAEMAEYADALILVWDGESRGSASMKREAEKRGLRIVERVL